MTVQRSPTFRLEVLTAYGYSPAECNGHSPTIYCLVLNKLVPKESLVVGHIFKHKWARVAQQVLGMDIDDTR
jgi:hypothetical protein